MATKTKLCTRNLLGGIVPWQGLMGQRRPLLLTLRRHITRAGCVHQEELYQISQGHMGEKKHPGSRFTLGLSQGQKTITFTISKCRATAVCLHTCTLGFQCFCDTAALLELKESRALKPRSHLERVTTWFSGTSVCTSARRVSKVSTLNGQQWNTHIKAAQVISCSMEGVTLDSYHQLCGSPELHVTFFSLGSFSLLFWFHRTQQFWFTLREKGSANLGVDCLLPRSPLHTVLDRPFRDQLGSKALIHPREGLLWIRKLIRNHHRNRGLHLILSCSSTPQKQEEFRTYQGRACGAECR